MYSSYTKSLHNIKWGLTKLLFGVTLSLMKILRNDVSKRKYLCLILWALDYMAAGTVVSILLISSEKQKTGIQLY